MTEPPDFRWNTLVRAAAQAPPRAVTAPLGFATRVVACWRARSAPLSAAALWHRLTLRALGVAFAILLAGLAANFILAENDVLNPGVADEVGNAFWLQ
jgi:hypothetical protein